MGGACGEPPLRATCRRVPRYNSGMGIRLLNAFLTGLLLLMVAPAVLRAALFVRPMGRPLILLGAAVAAALMLHNLNGWIPQ